MKNPESTQRRASQLLEDFPDRSFATRAGVARETDERAGVAREADEFADNFTEEDEFPEGNAAVAFATRAGGALETEEIVINSIRGV